MKLRTGKPGDLRNVQVAINYLRLARNLLVAVGAKKSADRVRHALKSAEGAERHAQRCEPGLTIELDQEKVQ